MLRKLMIIIPSLLALGAGAYYFSILGSEVALMDEHPDYDPKLVIKVHREIIKETLGGMYADVETDEEWDKIFRQKLIDYTSK